MRSRASLWHIPLVLAALVAGCYDMHGRSTPLPGPGPDPEPPRPRDAGADVRDFRDVAPVDAAALDRCAEVLALLRAGVRAEEIGCDGRTFPRDCFEPVNECCQLALLCEIAPSDGGHVSVVLTCDDSCAQGCGTYDDEDCALVSGCEWFDPHACGPAPGFIEGPACIDERGALCSSDAECPDGQRCRGYWINPCAGAVCDACGGEEWRCSY